MMKARQKLTIFDRLVGPRKTRTAKKVLRLPYDPGGVVNENARRPMRGDARRKESEDQTTRQIQHDNSYIHKHL